MSNRYLLFPVLRTEVPHIERLLSEFTTLSDVQKSILKKMNLLYHITEVSYAGGKLYYDREGLLLMRKLNEYSFDRHRYQFIVKYYDRKGRKQIYLFN